MSHTTLKRDIHPVLKTLLNWDVEVSKKFVKFVDMNFGPISKYNGLLKTLEISCHGIPWFIGLVITVLLIGFSSYYLIFPLPILMLLWCSAICLSRVLMRRHHILDVLGGAFIGWFEAVFISNFIWLSNDTCNSLTKYVSL
ncbi:Inactive phospholipid phosphatase 7, partial [Armadillidium vulgare]